MNHTTFNDASFGCGFAVFLVNPANTSPNLRAAFIFRIVVNVLIILTSENVLGAGIIMVSVTLLIILPIYLSSSVYREVRLNEKQIAANQVSS